MDILQELQIQLELATGPWLIEMKRHVYFGPRHFEVQKILDKKLAIQDARQYNPEKLKDIPWKDWAHRDKYMWKLLNICILDCQPDGLLRDIQLGEVILPKGINKDNIMEVINFR